MQSHTQVFPERFLLPICFLLGIFRFRTSAYPLEKIGAPDRIRTCDLWNRKKTFSRSQPREDMTEARRRLSHHAAKLPAAGGVTKGVSTAPGILLLRFHSSRSVSKHDQRFLNTHSPRSKMERLRPAATILSAAAAFIDCVAPARASGRTRSGNTGDKGQQADQERHERPDLAGHLIRECRS